MDAITRLRTAEPCGLVRDGYTMTTVRLADAQAVADAALNAREECLALRSRNQELRDSRDRLLAEINGYQDRIARAREHLT